MSLVCASKSEENNDSKNDITKILNLKIEIKRIILVLYRIKYVGL